MTTIALITGANKGIGFETARLLGARGVTVLAGARDEAKGLEAERLLRADRMSMLTSVRSRSVSPENPAGGKWVT